MDKTEISSEDLKKLDDVLKIRNSLYEAISDL